MDPFAKATAAYKATQPKTVTKDSATAVLAPPQSILATFDARVAANKAALDTVNRQIREDAERRLREQGQRWHMPVESPPSFNPLAALRLAQPVPPTDADKAEARKTLKRAVLHLSNMKTVLGEATDAMRLAADLVTDSKLDQEDAKAAHARALASYTAALKTASKAGQRPIALQPSTALRDAEMAYNTAAAAAALASLTEDHKQAMVAVQRASDLAQKAVIAVLCQHAVERLITLLDLETEAAKQRNELVGLMSVYFRLPGATAHASLPATPSLQVFAREEPANAKVRPNLAASAAWQVAFDRLLANPDVEIQ